MTKYYKCQQDITIYIFSQTNRTYYIIINIYCQGHFDDTSDFRGDRSHRYSGQLPVRTFIAVTSTYISLRDN